MKIQLSQKDITAAILSTFRAKGFSFPGDVEIVYSPKRGGGDVIAADIVVSLDDGTTAEEPADNDPVTEQVAEPKPAKAKPAAKPAAKKATAAKPEAESLNVKGEGSPFATKTETPAEEATGSKGSTDKEEANNPVRKEADPVKEAAEEVDPAFDEAIASESGKSLFG